MLLRDHLAGPTVEPVRQERGWFGYNGNDYWFPNLAGSNPEHVDGTFRQLVERVHHRSGPVAAAVAARMFPLSQVRFRWRNRDGELVQDTETDLMNNPGSTTRTSMLSRMEQDVSYAGNAYVARPRSNRRRLYRLAPDRVTFVFGSDSDPDWTEDGTQTIPYDAEIIGLVYDKHQYSTGTAGDLEVFRPGEFIQWAPEPDPAHWWRGASWVLSLLREIGIDGQVIDHEANYFKVAATPRLAFMMNKQLEPEEVKRYAAATNQLTEGTENAWKNLYIGGGLDKVEVVGNSLKDIGGELLRGGMETRISMRSRVPGSYLGIGVSYGGSTLNTGNFGSARRQFADGYFVPNTETLCLSSEAVLQRPQNAEELAFDFARVLLLQEDEKDAAEIIATQMQAYRTGVDGGAVPDTVREAIKTNDIGKVQHTGRTSVQLHDSNEPADE